MSASSDEIPEAFPTKQPAPAKDWCFTLNNPESREDEFYAIKMLDYQYLVYQVELGEQGTPHVQGFIQLREKMRMTALKKFLPTAHWEKRRGTPEEAAHYCKKPVPDCYCQHCKGIERFDDFFEDGIMSVDPVMELRMAAQVIKDKGLSHAVDRFPTLLIRYPTGMKALDHFYTPRRNFKTEVTIVYGVSGMGKSAYARRAPNLYLLPAAGGEGGTEFLGEYHPRVHESVLADEFFGNHLRFAFLQRLMDRHPMEAQTKGGWVQFLARHLVITSNLPPDEWYPKVFANKTLWAAFWRRLDNVIIFTEIGWKLIKV